MIKKILLGILAVIAGTCIVASFQSDEMNFTRSATINAPAATVFAHVNDPKKMDVWSPWLKPDPMAKKSFSGPAEGVGAVFEWDGNNEVGAGKMTIVESKPAELVRVKLDFLKPMESTAMADYSFKAEGNTTVMTQTFSSKKNFLSKVMCMFMNMDKMMGDQFEKGFVGIKAIVEKP